MSNAQGEVAKHQEQPVKLHQTMKKTPVISLLVSAALLGLCGCASDSAQKNSEPAQPKSAKPAKDTRPKEDRLKVGMTEEEVRTALGNPRGKSTNSDGSQTWMYNDAEKAIDRKSTRL